MLVEGTFIKYPHLYLHVLHVLKCILPHVHICLHVPHIQLSKVFKYPNLLKINDIFLCHVLITEQIIITKNLLCLLLLLHSIMVYIKGI